MVGRESTRANNLFYTCSLIDYIGRKTKNRRSDVVDALGRDRIARIIELADVYHSDNIDAVSDSFLEEAGLADGTFDNVSAAKYAVPSHWDIGKVYKRLVMGIAENQAVSDVEALFRAPVPFCTPTSRESGTDKRARPRCDALRFGHGPFIAPLARN